MIPHDRGTRVCSPGATRQRSIHGQTTGRARTCLSRTAATRRAMQATTASRGVGTEDVRGIAATKTTTSRTTSTSDDEESRIRSERRTRGGLTDSSAVSPKVRASCRPSLLSSQSLRVLLEHRLEVRRLRVRSRAHRSPTSANRAGAVTDREVPRIDRLRRVPSSRAASRRRRSRWRARCRRSRASCPGCSAGSRRRPCRALRAFTMRSTVATFGCASRRRSRRSGRTASRIRTDVPAAAECRCAGPRARRLRHRRDLQRVELVADPARDVEHLRERRVVARIEIERDVVGVERRLHAREPRVLRDRGNLRHVEQRDQRPADEAGGRPARRSARARRAASRCARPAAASPRDGAAGRTPGRRRRSGKRFITSGRSATAGRSIGATVA